MLKIILKFFNKFLTHTLFICFLVFIFAKYKIFLIKTSIKEIDMEINKIKDKNAILDIEISYLTNPERLIKIYRELYHVDYSDSIIAIKQVKNITDVLLYYNSKNKENKNE